ncbi:MAG: hypothetical protein AAF636_13190 [Pseudomonadota bacterium]
MSLRITATDQRGNRVFTSSNNIAVPALDTAASATVGAAATTDGTASLGLTAPFSGTNPTAITYWGIITEAAITGNRDMFGFIGELNEIQMRASGAVRLKIDDGPNSDNELLAGSGDYNQGDQLAFVASFDAATDAWVIAAKRQGLPWAVASGTNTSVTAVAINGLDFGIVEPDGTWAGGIIRMGVAIGVALDGASGTVQDALIQNGGDTPVISAATLQALMAGGTVGVDMYGGTARFNAGTNDGAWGDMTATGTWT